MNCRTVRSTSYHLMRSTFTLKGLLWLLGLACLSACSAPRSASNVPFELVRNVPLVKANVGQENDLKFLIDTGVDPSVIDLETAKRLGLPIDETEVGEASGTGDGEGLEIMRSEIIDLSLGEQFYPSTNALAADLSGFGNALDVRLAGILGFSFLNQRTVRLDYRRQEIAIASMPEDLPNLSSPTASTYTIPLRFNSAEDPIPVFEIQIDGEPVTVSLDTGKSAGIEFFSATVEDLGLKSLITDQSESQRLGARGSRTVTTGTLNAISIGPFELYDVPVSFSSNSHGDERRQGNAGNSIFQEFVVTIDYAGGTLTFAK